MATICRIMSHNVAALRMTSRRVVMTNERREKRKLKNKFIFLSLKYYYREIYFL